MKIAFVANTCWNIYNFRKGLVHHFLSKGYEVLVLAPKDEYTNKIIKWGLKWIDTPLHGTSSNPIHDFSYLRKLNTVFKNERPDIALSFTIKANIYASLAGKFTSTPVICNVSGLGTVFLVKGLIGNIALNLYKVAFKSSKYVFFQNEDDKELFLSHVKIPESKVDVLPGSGIDLRQYNFTPLPKNDHVQFLMIARLIIEKGVRQFAEAAAYFKETSNIRFVLVGKFDPNHTRSIAKSELDEWISNETLEYIPHSERIKALISESDVIVLPSYREGTPRTLLEGAALGRPLLATNVPGCKEVVRDGYNGFLFELKNPKSLQDKIKLFLSLSLEERMLLATNSRKLVEERFDENIVIDTYDLTIRRILETA